MNSKRFSAPWGKLLSTFTIIGATCMVLAALTAVLSEDLPAIARVATLAGAIGVTILCALGAVRGYRIEGDKLMVERLLWETEIDLRGLESVEHHQDLIKGSLRVGNGGFFVFSGWFWSRKLGWFRLMGNDIIGRAVLLSIKGKRWMVTPSHPHTFVEELESRISAEKAQTS